MRVFVPLFGLIAMLALFAGAYGDLPSLREELPAAVSRLETAAEGKISGWRAQASSTETVTAPDLDRGRRETQDLRKRVEDQGRELATLRASSEQTRQDLAALREQHQRDQAALDQLTAMRNAARTAADDRQAGTRSPVAGSSHDVMGQPDSASSDMKQTPAVRNLLAARTALASGRGPKARRLLGVARAQMAVRASAETSNAAPGNAPATRVTYAISLLDRGDSGGALQAIDQALTESRRAMSGGP